MIRWGIPAMLALAATGCGSSGAGGADAGGGSGGGVCSDFSIGGNTPDTLAADATNLYWGVASQGPPYVGATSLSGRGGEVLVSSGVFGPAVLAVDSSRVYWTQVANPGGVFAVPIGGGAVTTLAASGPGYGLAVDASNAYFADTQAGVIARVPLAGGAVVTLATGYADALGTRTPGNVAVDATNVYFTTEGTTNTGVCKGIVASVPLAGGAVTTLASGYCLPRVVTAAGSVYFSASGGVYRLPTGGGSPVTITTTAFPPNALVIDRQTAYYTLPGNTGSVEKVSLSGGAAITLVGPIKGPAALAVGPSCVYYSSAQRSGVAALPK